MLVPWDIRLVNIITFFVVYGLQAFMVSSSYPSAWRRMLFRHFLSFVIRRFHSIYLSQQQTNAILANKCTSPYVKQQKLSEGKKKEKEECSCRHRANRSSAKHDDKPLGRY